MAKLRDKSTAVSYRKCIILWGMSKGDIHVYVMTWNGTVGRIWPFTFNVLLAMLTTTFLKSDQNIINQPCTKGNKSETTTEYEDEDVKIDDNIHMQNPSGPLYVSNECFKEISLSYLSDVIVDISRNENLRNDKDLNIQTLRDDRPIDVDVFKLFCSS